jgi:hypothetical protein
MKLLLTLALFSLSILFSAQLAAAGAQLTGLEGWWLFETTGTQGAYGATASNFTRSMRIEFKDGAFANNPFGYQASGGKLTRCEPGGPIAFITDYKIENSAWNINWKGTVSKDGNSITAGEWNFIMASGTFTAKRDAIIVTSNRSTALAKGGSVEASFALNLKPLKPVTVTVARTKGEERITLKEDKPLTFTPENWQTPQTVSIVADAAVKSSAVATFTASGDGMAPAVVMVKVKNR